MKKIFFVSKDVIEDDYNNSIVMDLTNDFGVPIYFLISDSKKMKDMVNGDNFVFVTEDEAKSKLNLEKLDEKIETFGFHYNGNFYSMNNYPKKGDFQKLATRDLDFSFMKSVIQDDRIRPYYVDSNALLKRLDFIKDKDEWNEEVSKILDLYKVSYNENFLRNAYFNGFNFNLMDNYIKSIPKDNSYMEEIIQHCVDIGIYNRETKCFTIDNESVISWNLMKLISNDIEEVIIRSNNEIVSNDRNLDLFPNIKKVTYDGCVSKSNNLKFVEKVAVKNVETTKIKFSYNSKITDVDISECYGDIPDFFVQMCISLENVKLSKNCTKIGMGAFEGTRIKEINIPEECTEIRLGAFQNCRNIEEVILPSQIKEVKNLSFSGCSNLKHVVINDACEKISDRAFENCFSLVNFEMGNNVNSIGDNAFYRCTHLENIDLKNVQKLGKSAFENCGQLRQIQFNDGINLDVKTFYGCSSLNIENMLDKIAYAGKLCFGKCEIEKLVISDKMKDFAEDSFDECDSINEVVKDSDDAHILVSSNNVKKIRYTSNCKNVDRIITGRGLKVDEIVVEEGNNGINRCAFWGISSVEKVKLADSIEIIVDDVFEKFCDIGELNIPSNIKEYRYDGFGSNLNVRKLNVKNVYLKGNIYDNYSNYSNYRNYGKSRFVHLMDSFNDDGKIVFDENFNFEIRDLIDDDLYRELSRRYNPRRIPNLFLDKYLKFNELDFSNVNVDELNVKFYDMRNAERIILPKSLKTIKAYQFSVDTYSDLPKAEIELVLPENLKEIKECAFLNFPYFSKLELQDSIEKVGKYAFKKCLNLKEVKLPSSLEEIEEFTFEECEDLEKIIIPASVKKIKKGAFKNCSKLKEVVFEGDEIEFKESVFEDCVSLEKIELPKNTKALADRMFFNCEKLEQVLGIENVTKIGNRCFSQNKNLKEFEILEGVTKLGCDVFYGCSSLITVNNHSKISEIPSGIFEECGNLSEVTGFEDVEKIGGNAFKKSGIRNLTFGKNLNLIGCYAFENCSNLETLELNSDLKFIGDLAFDECVALKNFKIPKSVKIIGRYAFNNCENIFDLEIPKNIEKIGAYAFSHTQVKEAVGLNNVIEIGKGAFFECQSLEVVDLGENRTEDFVINAKIFSNCQNLKSVILSPNTTKVGEYAFENCSNLENLNLPNGLRVLDDYALVNNKSLSNLYIPDSVTNLGYQVIKGCTGLEYCSFPKGMGIDLSLPCNISQSVICNGSFYERDVYGDFKKIEKKNNNELTSINMDFVKNRNVEYILVEKQNDDNSVALSLRDLSRKVDKSNEELNIESEDEKLEIENQIDDESVVLRIPSKTYDSVGSMAFAELLELREVRLPEGIKRIGMGAFYNCPNLERVILPDSVEEIDEFSFTNCRKLKYVNIPPKVKRLGRKSFKDCYELPQIKLPDDISVIEEQTFDDCFNLSIVSLPKNLQKIDRLAFFNCRNLFSFYLPKDLKEINDYAFCNCNISQTEDLTSEDIRKKIDFIFEGDSYKNQAFNERNVDKKDVEKEDEGLTYLRKVFTDAALNQFSAENSGEVIKPQMSDAEIENLAVANNAFEKKLILAIPSGVKRIGKYAFAHMKNVQLICVQPDSELTEIDDYAFEGCKSLQMVDYLGTPDKRIGKGAFSGCTSLTKIDGIVSEMDDESFKDCSSLEYVITKCENGKTRIGRNVFEGCDNLKVVQAVCDREDIEGEVDEERVIISILEEKKEVTLEGLRNILTRRKDKKKSNGEIET